MAQEEQAQKYSNSSSGGANGGGGSSTARSCKKLKQKKIPQRGLGVAQLERIRLEEQQKKDGLSLQTSTLLPSANSIVYMGNSCLDVPDVALNDLQLPNSIPRQRGLILNSDATHLDSSSVSLSNNAASNWGKIWNSEYNRNVESQKFDYHSLAIHSNGNLPYETKTPVWPFPGIVHRSEQYQHPCPSPMVNVPSGNLNSSVSNLQIEPPSNQIYSTPLWQEEERMVGAKRSYPFVIEDAPGPSFNIKHPPAYASLIHRKDEAAPCSNDGISHIEPPANALFLREFPLSSIGMPELKNKKLVKESGGSNGDFLTLAPPREELPSSYLSHHCHKVPDFDALPYQDTANEPVKWPEQGRSIQQPFYNFLPEASAVNGLPAGTANGNGKQTEAVDLNLKL